jgi:uncharacterized membrane protein YgcG
MKSGRFLFSVMFFIVVLFFRATNAPAFWGFGEETSWEKSGLDFDRGYDRNTETTVQGKVVSREPGSGSGPVVITLRQADGAVLHVVAAPAWFWSDRGITLKPNDDVEATGSKAQGKDGKIYLISRVITNHTDKETITLRDEIGRPGWRGGSRSQQSSGGGQRRMGGGGRRR